MKKKIIIFIVAFMCLPPTVQAAPSASISASSSVEVGSKVTATVTLKNTAAWNVQIISSGSTSGCSQKFADATSNAQNTTKKLSVTCKATGVGAIAFTVTGDITSADGTKSNVSLSKRVTVTEVRPKSTDATLSSLSIEGYELTPTFNQDTLEYSTTLPSTVNKINISAKVNESHASVTGTGEFEVTEGINTFNIVVTAESGTQKTYVITANVEDINPIEIKIDGKKYTIVKNAKNLIKPELYEETTVKIGEFDIPAFYSDTTKFTLIGVKDESGKVELAIYNEKTNNYILYNEFSANTLVLYITNFPKVIENYMKDTIKINDVEVEVYRYKENSRFVICYAMNATTGEYNYYSYDTKENTFQIYNDEEQNELREEMKTYIYVCIAFGGGLLFAFILIICLLSSKKKKTKKIENKKKENLTKKEDKTEEPKEEKKEKEEKVIESDEEMYDLLETMKKKKKKRDANKYNVPNVKD